MTRYKRGAVILVKYPNSDLVSYKRRPALVVQADDLGTGLNQTIVVLITSNLERRGPTRVRVDLASEMGDAMGILCDSVIVADNIATVLDKEIERRIGEIEDMSAIDEALRRALHLS